MQYLPDLEGDEATFVQGLMRDMSESQGMRFAEMYRNSRKSPGTLLGACCAGFVGFAGIHHFMLGKTGMGLLYLFTLGFCTFGTIMDLFRVKKLAYEFNIGKAQRAAVMAKSSS